MRRPRVKHRLVVAGLVAANLVPLVGAVWFGWEVATLIGLYWLEGIVAALEAVMETLRAEGREWRNDLPDWRIDGRPVSAWVGDPNSKVARDLVEPFLFLWGFFGFPAIVYLLAAPPVEIALGIGVLVAYRGASYRLEYIGDGEYEDTEPVERMLQLYWHVRPLIVTVWFGLIVGFLLGSSIGLVVVMVAVKTVSDLRSHSRKHDYDGYLLSFGGTE